MDTRDVEAEQVVEGSPLPAGLLCPECGYDLRGLTSDRCPECGFELAPLRTQESQIPWNYRAKLGCFRAYWRTVWKVERRPQQFCLEIARPVNAADARRFAYVTMLHAWLACVAAATAVYVFSRVRGWGDASVNNWLYGGGLVWSFVLLAILPTWVPLWLESVRLSPERQNRAYALSYYALAPLAWLPLAVPPLVAALLLRDVATVASASSLGIGGIILPRVVWASDRRLNSFMRQLIEPNWWARNLKMLLARCALVGLAWLLLLVPITAFCVAVVYQSLR